MAIDKRIFGHGPGPEYRDSNGPLKNVRVGDMKFRTREQIAESIEQRKAKLVGGVRCKGCFRATEVEKVRKGYCPSCVVKLARIHAQRKAEREEARLEAIRVAALYKDSEGIF